MTDPITREDLEMAAKAAGLEVLWDEVDEAYLLVEDDASARHWEVWTPNDDDGDCARMEAAVGINVKWYDDCVDVTESAWSPKRDLSIKFADHGHDKSRARRYASVKLAAAVGRGMA